MKYNKISLISRNLFKLRILYLVLFLINSVVSWGQTDPYLDGATLLDGANLSQGGQSWSVAANTTVTGLGEVSASQQGAVNGSLIINGLATFNAQVDINGRVEVFGSLEAVGIYVSKDGVLIVHGDADMTYWGYRIEGTVIILGDVKLSNFTLEGSGNLVVVGDVIIENGGGGSVIDGDVYQLDPESEVKPVGNRIIDEDETKTEEELINSDDYDDLEDILKDVGLVTSVDKPKAFTYSNLSGTSADFSWELNDASDDVVVAIVADNFTGKPEDETSYDVNDTFDGATVIYVGDASNLPFTYNALNAGATNYLCIWSVSTDVEYSATCYLTVKALSSNTIFYDDFEGSTSGEGTGVWTDTEGAESGGYKSGNNWHIGSDEKYMGSKSKYISNNSSDAKYNMNPTWTGNDYVTNSKLSLSGIDAKYKSVALTFYWKCVGEHTRDYGSVNAGSITYDGFAGQKSWIEETIDISDLVSGGQASVDFKFTTNTLGGTNPGFCIDEVRVIGSEVERVQSFRGSALSSEEVALEWTPNSENNNVLIAYSLYGSIGQPESGKVYTSGDILPDGGIVVYSGSGTNYAHVGNFSGELSYKIWSIKGGFYSSPKAIKVRMPVALPFSDGFEEDVSVWSFGDGANKWVQGSAVKASGDKSAYISNNLGITAEYEITTPAENFLELDVDLRGLKSAQLSYKWMCKGEVSYPNGWGYPYGAFGELYINSNLRSNTAEYYNNTLWVSENYNFVSGELDNITTIAFKWRNEQDWWGGTAGNQPPGFCIDDVYITGVLYAPKSFSAINSNDVFNNLSWQLNDYGDEVVIAVSEDGSFGTPNEGVIYKLGDKIGDATVIYVGGETSFTHEPLKYGTVYNYKMWSARKGIFSNEDVTASANTPTKATLFFEDWDNTPTPANLSWTTTSNSTDTWQTHKNAPVDGNITNFAFISSDGTNADYKAKNPGTEAYLETYINLDELATAKLSFDWVANGEPNNQQDYGEVYLNGDLLSGSKEFKWQTSWQNYSISLNNYCGKGLGNIKLQFKWVNVWNNRAYPGFCIDNIEISTIYAATSTVGNGVKKASTISSLNINQANAVEVFSFDLTDKTSSYNDVTRIQQIIVGKGSANVITEWKTSLAGALLFGPDIPAEGMIGIITESGIIFTGEDFIVLEKQDSPETYTLKVWLHEDLNESGFGDGDVFDFEVNSNNIVTGLGDDFLPDNIVSSGAIAIDVVATDLFFTQQPSPNASVAQVLAQPAIISACDMYGNVDKDFESNITISNDGGIGMINSSIKATNGIAEFADLTFNSEGIVKLSTNSGSLTSEYSEEVNISNYCIPNNNPKDRYITNVIINHDKSGEALNNASGDDGGYGDYLDIVSSLIAGESYEVSIGVHNSIGTGYAIVWVDWNGDKDFEDDGEIFELGNRNSSGIITGNILVPSGALAGKTRMRVRFANIKDNNDPCASLSGEVEDYTVLVSSNGWQGQNQKWFVTSNWATGEVPTGGDNVFIPESPLYGKLYPVISIGEAIEMKNLDIDRNALFTIQPGAKVDIYGNLTCASDNQFVVQNTTAAPSSVIIEGDVNTKVQVEWTYASRRYWYIGQATNGATVGDYGIPTADVYIYDFPGYWNPFNDIATLLNSELEGYSVMFKDPKEVIVSGKLNTGEQSRLLPENSDRLVANPYLSYLNLDNKSGFEFGDAQQTVWTRTTFNSERALATYNITEGQGANGGTKHIAPGQSFWVQTNSQPTTFKVNYAARVHGEGALKSIGNANLEGVFRFVISDGEIADEGVLIFREYGESFFSVRDSEKRIVSEAIFPQIYSLKSDKKVTISVVSNREATQSIPLGLVIPADGEYIFNATNISGFMPEYGVTLEDVITGDIYDMRNNPTVSLSLSKGTYDDRYLLHFNKTSTDVGEGIEDSETNKPTIYAANGDLYVKINSEQFNNNVDDCFVEVYDFIGNKYINQALLATQTQFELPEENKLWIIVVRIGNNSYQEKVSSFK